MKVEYYRLWGAGQGTWDTAYIDIPDGTPDSKMDEAIRARLAKLVWSGDPPCVVGFYSAVIAFGDEDEDDGEGEDNGETDDQLVFAARQMVEQLTSLGHNDASNVTYHDVWNTLRGLVGDKLWVERLTEILVRLDELSKRRRTKSNVHVALYDGRGVVVEERVAAPEEAAALAGRFVLLHGGGPDEPGASVGQPGRIEFRPTDAPVTGGP